VVLTNAEASRHMKGRRRNDAGGEQRSGGRPTGSPATPPPQKNSPPPPSDVSVCGVSAALPARHHTRILRRRVGVVTPPGLSCPAPRSSPHPVAAHPGRPTRRRAEQEQHRTENHATIIGAASFSFSPLVHPPHQQGQHVGPWRTSEARSASERVRRWERDPIPRAKRVARVRECSLMKQRAGGSLRLGRSSPVARCG